MTKAAGINPRVVIWANLHDVPLNRLQREDPIREELYEIDGAPWTMHFMFWCQDRWREFRKQCHGNETRGECCAGASTDGRFDTWLRGAHT